MNKLDKKEYMRKYRQVHKKEGNEYLIKWRKNNPDKVKEYRKYNKEYIKQWKKDNPEYEKQWYQDNKDKIAKIKKKYRESEKGKATDHRKYVKKRAIYKYIFNTLTAKEWIDILKQYKFRCAYCGKEFDLFIKPERDHVVPLSKGGNNIKENVVPACKLCNIKKYNKIINLEEVKINGIH